MEEKLVPAQGLELETLRIRGVQPEPWRNLPLVYALPAALRRAVRVVGRFHPDAVFGTGGYVVGPVGVAAWVRRVPLVLQLPDAVPGRTIRVLAPRARAVCVAFESSRQRLSTRTVVTGTPVRPEFVAAGRARRLRGGGGADAFRLAVLGGIQGAHRLNTAAAPGLQRLLDPPR